MAPVTLALGHREDDQDPAVAGRRAMPAEDPGIAFPQHLEGGRGQRIAGRARPAHAGQQLPALEPGDR